MDSRFIASGGGRPASSSKSPALASARGSSISHPFAVSAPPLAPWPRLALACFFFLPMRSTLLTRTSTGTSASRTRLSIWSSRKPASSTSVMKRITSESSMAQRTAPIMPSWSLYLGFTTPGVSEKTICHSGAFAMPMMRCLVVEALAVAMLRFSPRRWFIMVDLPTLGLPTMLTKPARCVSGKGSKMAPSSSIAAIVMAGLEPGGRGDDRRAGPHRALAAARASMCGAPAAQRKAGSRAHV
mmetsp:Transcript_14842/g.45333  ORF Transcript_14842/g.45333 Transcript_14842/m.45333 type:complete len:242 (+) Transcript_14842:864-1589(+)